MLQSKILEVIRAPLEEANLTVVAIYAHKHNQLKVEVLLEGKDGQSVTIEACVKARRIISTHLDVEELITEPYLLEVSSAGIDRPLIKPEDFQRFLNHKVNIHLHEAMDSVKKVKGFIQRVQENEIEIEIHAEDLKDQATIVIPFNNIKKAKLDLDYMIDLKLQERKQRHET